MYNSLYQSQSLYYKSEINSDPTLIVDPSMISSKDEIAIEGYSVSKDSKYIAYQFSRNGSDWLEIKVEKINGRNPKDHLENIIFSEIHWKGNGFFYSTSQQKTKSRYIFKRSHLLS